MHKLHDSVCMYLSPGYRASGAGKHFKVQNPQDFPFLLPQGLFFPHQKPQNSVSCRYKQCPEAPGNSRGKHCVTPQASARVQGQISTSQPQNRGVGKEPNDWKSGSALARFPGDSKPHRAHGKIIQSQAKCCNWGGSQQTCVVFHLIFSWKITGDFSISFQKKPQKPCFIQISAFELCRDFYSKCQVTFSIRNIEDWVLNERRPLPPEKCSFFSSVFSGPPENYQWQ